VDGKVGKGVADGKSAADNVGVACGAKDKVRQARKNNRKIAAIRRTESIIAVPEVNCYAHPCLLPIKKITSPTNFHCPPFQPPHPHLFAAR
jgi:hypothetical protein